MLTMTPRREKTQEQCPLHDVQNCYVMFVSPPAGVCTYGYDLDNI